MNLATSKLSRTLVDIHLPRFKPLLERFIREQKIHPALLVTGLDGVGKKESVLNFIQVLFCDANDSVRIQGIACQKCASCTRALNGNWFDLQWYEPETKSDDETKIGLHLIETFLELKSKMGMGPAEEPLKVVVITEADRMKKESANSILKLLEEPPRNWIFILLSSTSTQLLPTIISRCIELKLPPLSPEQIYETLKEIQGSHFQSKQARLASHAGMGSLTRANYFLDDKILEVRNLILGLLSNPAAEYTKLIDQLVVSQRQMALGLDLLESLFSDLLHHQVQGSSSVWTHEDQKDFLIQWAESRSLTIPRTHHILGCIAENRKHMGTNANAKLLAQKILIPLLEKIHDRT